MPEAERYDEESFDKLLSVHVLLPRGEGVEHGQVIGRKCDQDGCPIGQSNANPLMNTRVYEVEFQDGYIQEYLANTIAENKYLIYSQVDTEDNEYILLQEICDHWKDGLAVAKDDMFVQHTRGGSNAVHRRTTKGWQLLVQWKDGSTSWTPLKDLKESNPIEEVEYAVANKIANEPAFIWWAKDVLRKHNQMIAKLRSRYWKRTHKFGVLIPKSVKEALLLDDEMGQICGRRPQRRK